MSTDAYKLGQIQVSVSESDKPDRLTVECNDGTYHSSFEVSRYEYENYRRHMNLKITQAYRKNHEADRDSESEELNT
ncbi:MAG: hypothetical protein WDZ29_02705 [Balneolaceae bacterium]